jgi:hypothetical protein
VTVSKELSKYKLTVVEVQRTDGRVVALNLQKNTQVFYRKGNENHELLVIGFHT